MSIVFPCQVDISGTELYETGTKTTLTPETITMINLNGDLQVDLSVSAGLIFTDTLNSTQLATFSKNGVNFSTPYEATFYSKTSSGDGGTVEINPNFMRLYDVSDNAITTLSRGSLEIGTIDSAPFAGIIMNDVSNNVYLTTSDFAYLDTQTESRYSFYAQDRLEFYKYDNVPNYPLTVHNKDGFYVNASSTGNPLTYHNASGFYVNTGGANITTIESTITTPNIKATNISDTTNSVGTNGQVLTKQTAGISWSPNFPNIATYRRAWATTSVNIVTNANTLLYTSDAILTGTATATYLITFQMTGQSSGNHSIAVTIGRGTVTPATDQAFNLAKPGANNLTAAINTFGSNLGSFGGGQPISVSTISFTDVPANTGTYYYSIWCYAGQNAVTTQWSNFNIIQIKP